MSKTKRTTKTTIKRIARALASGDIVGAKTGNDTITQRTNQHTKIIESADMDLISL
jgi:hypothetical protein